VIVVMSMRVLTVVALFSLLANAVPAWAQPAAPLTVERVASLPSLTGTAPASPVWSPDSRLLVFRWNEQGMPFRDLYAVDADGSNRRRLTDLQRTHPSPAPPEGTGTTALAAQAAARARGGVGEVIWLPDSRGVIFTYRGQAFRLAMTGSGPEALATGEGVSELALSPDATRLTFLRDGDLWSWPLDGTAAATRHTSLGIAGIARVPLGTYNRADVEVGTGVWGAELDAVRVGARWPHHRPPPRGPPPHPQGAVPVVPRRGNRYQRTAPRLPRRRERAARAHLLDVASAHARHPARRARLPGHQRLRLVAMAAC
jgi:hypothetical protein